MRVLGFCIQVVRYKVSDQLQVTQLATCGLRECSMLMFETSASCSKHEVSAAQDVYSTALHPSGELLLLGCATRLRMYSVLADDIR